MSIKLSSISDKEERKMGKYRIISVVCQYIKLLNCLNYNKHHIEIFECISEYSDLQMTGKITTKPYVMDELCHE
jgi:hypothetical protein